jgi:hypothetical protein
MNHTVMSLVADIPSGGGRDQKRAQVDAYLDQYARLRTQPADDRVLVKMEEALRAATNLEIGDGLRPEAAFVLAEFLGRRSRSKEAVKLCQQLRSHDLYASDRAFRARVSENLNVLYQEIDRLENSDVL